MSAERLVSLLRAQGVLDPRVLRAFQAVPRDRFVLPEYQDEAWEDTALPIGLGQTISQPFVIALGLQRLSLQGTEKVLELGTGSGYQTALLTLLCREAYTIELLEPLLLTARARLRALGYAERLRTRHGDGYLGWAEAAPFDAIVISAALREVPPLLLEQLAPGGTVIAPIGGPAGQELVALEKRGDGSVIRHPFLPVRFVPLVHP